MHFQRVIRYEAAVPVVRAEDNCDRQSVRLRAVGKKDAAMPSAARAGTLQDVFYVAVDVVVAVVVVVVLVVIHRPKRYTYWSSGARHGAF